MTNFLLFIVLQTMEKKKRFQLETALTREKKTFAERGQQQPKEVVLDGIELLPVLIMKFCNNF